MTTPARLTPTEKSVPTGLAAVALEPGDDVRGVELQVDFDVVRGQPGLQIGQELVEVVEPAGDSSEQALELPDERRAEEDEDDDHHGRERQVDHRHRQPARQL